MVIVDEAQEASFRIRLPRASLASINNALSSTIIEIPLPRKGLISARRRVLTPQQLNELEVVSTKTGWDLVNIQQEVMVDRENPYMVLLEVFAITETIGTQSKWICAEDFLPADYCYQRVNPSFRRAIKKKGDRLPWGFLLSMEKELVASLGQEYQVEVTNPFQRLLLYALAQFYGRNCCKIIMSDGPLIKSVKARVRRTTSPLPEISFFKFLKNKLALPS